MGYYNIIPWQCSNIVILLQTLILYKSVPKLFLAVFQAGQTRIHLTYMLQMSTIYKIQYRAQDNAVLEYIIVSIHCILTKMGVGGI